MITITITITIIIITIIINNFTRTYKQTKNQKRNHYSITTLIDDSGEDQPQKIHKNTRKHKCVCIYQLGNLNLNSPSGFHEIDSQDIIFFWAIDSSKQLIFQWINIIKEHLNWAQHSFWALLSINFNTAYFIQLFFSHIFAATEN